MIAEILHSLRKWRQERHALEALGRLTDHQLNDIGLTRFNLEHAIRSGRRS